MANRLCVTALGPANDPETVAEVAAAPIKSAIKFFGATVSAHDLAPAAACPPLGTLNRQCEPLP